MAKNQIFPACLSYYDKILNTFKTAKELRLPFSFIYSEVSVLGDLLSNMKKAMDKLENSINNSNIQLRDDTDDKIEKNIKTINELMKLVKLKMIV